MSDLLTKQTEEALVCSLLMKQSNLPDVAGWLLPGMFESPELAFIYSAILAQYERGIKPDLITTDNEMKRIDSGRYEAMDGTAFLSSSLLRIRHSGNVTTYAEEVKRLYLLRSLEKLFTASKAKASQPETDCSALINETEQALLDIRQLQMKGTKQMDAASELVKNTLDYHIRRMEQGQDAGRIMTGIDEFDAIVGGMHAGELIVGAGRPGDGKSAVAIQVAINAAMKKKRVCFFSLEMTDIQIMNRLFAGHAGIHPMRLRESKLEQTDLEKMQNLGKSWKDLSFYLDYTVANSVENIRAQVIFQRKRMGCDLVVVDYLHLLESKQRKGENLEQAIARNIRALKNLSKEADCPVLVLSQMNRASETRPDKAHMPILSDLRDSGTIEQVADCVFFVYRPERHGITKDEVTGEDLTNSGKLIIVKNRNGGIGSARFRHNESFTQITKW